MEVDLPGPPRRCYQHGWQSWSDTRWLDPSRPPLRNPVAARWPMVDDPAHATSRRHGGSAVAAVDLGADEVVLLGALDVGGRVELEGPRLVGQCEGGSGEWFVARGSELDVFAQYADALGARFGRRPPRHPRIWCSWYSFYSAISESRLHEVIDELEGMPFDLVQIDDGWQQGIGEWHANERFPSGMPALAKRIRNAGFEPGLWLAPFLVRADTSVVARHPEMLLRGDDGDPVFAGNNWGGPCVALDVTHPHTLEWLTETITRAVDDGFSYLKLDFLYAAALPGRRHVEVPREQAYRDAVELVRRVAGNDVYLLACGAPVVPSLGVFDAIRVGPDVAPWWDMSLVTQYLHDPTAPSTRFAIATSANRLWLAPLIEPDPDVVYFRRRYNLLSRAQRTLLQDLATVCGFRATSDPPSWLDGRELEQMVSYFSADDPVDPLDRLRFTIGGRAVDFRAVADEDPGFVSWL